MLSLKNVAPGMLARLNYYFRCKTFLSTTVDSNKLHFELYQVLGVVNKKSLLSSTRLVEKHVRISKDRITGNVEGIFNYSNLLEKLTPIFGNIGLFVCD